MHHHAAQVAHINPALAFCSTVLAAVFAYGFLSPWLSTLRTGGRKVGKIGWNIVGFFGMVFWMEFSPLMAWFVLVPFAAIPMGIVCTRKIKGNARAEAAAEKARRESLARERELLAEMRARGPIVDIARGTGKLAARGHGSAIRIGEPVLLDDDVMFGGTLVLGPMGAGKTRAIAQPWIGHWLNYESAGLFAYGVKPNWSSTIVRIAKAVGRRDDQIHVLGAGHSQWAIIVGLEPDNLANFCADAFNRNGGNGSNQYFSDSAVNLVRRSGGIAYYATLCGRRLVADTLTATGETLTARTLGYDLESISEIVHARDADWEAIAKTVRGRIAELTATDRETADDLEHALKGYERLVKDLDPKTRASVVSQIDTVIEPFVSSRELRRAFCGDESLDLETALADGGVVILDVDLGKFAAAARLVYLLAFEQMRRLMLRRIARIDGGERVDPVAFVADEYAEVASKAHRSMWRLARESRIAPLVCYQLHSDLRTVAGGQDAADGLVAGFRTKILFSTDDKASVDLVSGALGQVNVEFETRSHSEGSSDGWNTGQQHGPQGQSSSGSTSGSSSSDSWSTSIQQRLVIDPQVVQSMTNHIRRGVPLEEQIAEAILIGEMHGRRVADVVRVKAWDPPVTSSVETEYGTVCGSPNAIGTTRIAAPKISISAPAENDAFDSAADLG